MSLIDRPRVAVLYGGDSNERDVSLETGTAVGCALEKAGYHVTMIDTRYVPPAGFDHAAIDVAFIALHGTFGEDGGIQAILDDMAIPYTGSGVEASQAAMDKLLSKKRFGQALVRTPSFEEINGEWPAERQLATARLVVLPAIIKPAAEGSSVGVSKVERKEELPAAIAKALQSHTHALAEEYIGGRELTVGILDDDPLPIIELLYEGDVFTKEIKYKPGAATHIVEPDLPPGVAEDVTDMALLAHQSLGCGGCTRVDLKLDEANCPWILEVNTIPGMTATSLIPDAASAVGISFTRLCEMIVEMALRDRTGVLSARGAAAHSVGV
jgi:D-alanine-D-alanine ligase